MKYQLGTIFKDVRWPNETHKFICYDKGNTNFPYIMLTHRDGKPVGVDHWNLKGLDSLDIVNPSFDKTDYIIFAMLLSFAVALSGAFYTLGLNLGYYNALDSVLIHGFNTTREEFQACEADPEKAQFDCELEHIQKDLYTLQIGIKAVREHNPKELKSE